MMIHNDMAVPRDLQVRIDRVTVDTTPAGVNQGKGLAGRPLPEGAVLIGVVDTGSRRGALVRLADGKMALFCWGALVMLDQAAVSRAMTALHADPAPAST